MYFGLILRFLVDWLVFRNICIVWHLAKVDILWIEKYISNIFIQKVFWNKNISKFSILLLYVIFFFNLTQNQIWYIHFFFIKFKKKTTIEMQVSNVVSNKFQSFFLWLAKCIVFEVEKGKKASQTQYLLYICTVTYLDRF